MPNENELYHYGVIGMKWGVKRGRRAETINKSFKKLSKLDTKSSKDTFNYDKANAKYTKKHSKLVSAAEKANRKYVKSASSWRGYTEKTGKLKKEYETKKAIAEKHAADNQAMILKKKANALNKQVKTQKWANAMLKNIGTMKISEVPEESIVLAKKYLLAA